MFDRRLSFFLPGVGVVFGDERSLFPPLPVCSWRTQAYRQSILYKEYRNRVTTFSRLNWNKDTNKWYWIFERTHKLLCDFMAVNLGTKAAEQNSCNWDTQLIDSCKLELCVAKLSVVSTLLARAVGKKTLHDSFVMSSYESTQLYITSYRFINTFFVSNVEIKERFILDNIALWL